MTLEKYEFQKLFSSFYKNAPGPKKKEIEHFICPVPFLPTTESQFEKKRKDFS